MNRIYRTIWSPRLGSWVAVPERARGKGKGGGTCVRAGVLALATGLVGAPPAGAQLPAGGSVSAGSAAIMQHSPSAMTIQQSTPRAAINWQSFSIGAGSTVQFVQPSAAAVALNRVTGPDPSSIQGTLKANGQVFLINPNGVLFSPTAQVSVGGLVATTRQLPDEAFMNPRLNAAGEAMFTFEGDSAAGVTNQGTIGALPGGFVAMMAARVVNETADPARPASISAPGGSVLLGAGNTVTLETTGLARLVVERGALEAQISNGGAIQAAGGQILLSAKGADALSRAVIHQSGHLDASTLQRDAQGRIVLDVPGGALMHSGTTQADGLQGGLIEGRADTVIDSGQWLARGSEGAGGAIEVAATNHLEQTTSAQMDASGQQAGGNIRVTASQSAWLSGRLDASSAGGRGGQVSATASALTLAGGQMRADGALGGGQVRVGGGWQGGDADLANAGQTVVGAGSRLSADATAQGDGGTVVLWSQERTLAGDSISARGAGNGHGGRVEVSSRGGVGITAQVDVGAPAGAAGQLLLDPQDIVIGPQTTTQFFATTSMLDPSPSPGHYFGSGGVLELGNGNLVVNSPLYDLANAENAGAVRLYSSQGALRATLTGTRTEDRVGSGGVFAVGASRDSFIVNSPGWTYQGSQSPALAGAGAVTWIGKTPLPSLVVSGSNSLYGTHAGDAVGSGGITVLANGNYVVSSPNWNLKAGAVSLGLGDGASAGVPTAGAIGANNSLAGLSANSQVGSGGITLLPTGGFVVASPQAQNLDQGSAGAVTAIDDSGKLFGTASVNITSSFAMVGTDNSLMGAKAGDRVGAGGVVPLEGPSTAGGYYVVVSPYARLTSSTEAYGAFTLVKPFEAANVSGTVGTGNSLYASVGNGASLALTKAYGLPNGNYVAVMPSHYKGRGSVTYVHVATGSNVAATAISASNSVVGKSENGGWHDNNGYETFGTVGAAGGDEAGSGGIFVVDRTTSNYVILSPNYSYVDVDNTNFYSKLGSMTWQPGTGPTLLGENVMGSKSRATMGERTGDMLGSTVLTTGTQGTYAMVAPFWKSFALADAGMIGVYNAYSGYLNNSPGDLRPDSSNGIPGRTANDRLGADETGKVLGVALANGNYAIAAPLWNTAPNTPIGAVFLVGLDGRIVGATPQQAFTVSTTNSLTGSVSGDKAGSGGFVILPGNKFLVLSPQWSNGSALAAGAVTWSAGDITRATGPISAANSLVGSTLGDQVGSGGAITLKNGNYVVSSPWWDHAGLANVGAITLGDGRTGVKGAIQTDPNQPEASYIGSGEQDKLQATALASARQDNVVAVRSDPNTLTGARIDLVDLQPTSSLAPGPVVPYAYNPGMTLTLTPAQVSALLRGADVLLQAHRDIRVSEAINARGATQSLTLQAGRSVLLDAGITTDGDVTLVANDVAASGVSPTYRGSDLGTITMADGTSIDAGSKKVRLVVREGISPDSAGLITIGRIKAASLSIESPLFTATQDVQDKAYDGLKTAAPSATPFTFTGLQFTPTSGLRLQAVNPEYVVADALDLPLPATAGLQLVDASGAQPVITPLVQRALGMGRINRRALALEGNKVDDGTYFFNVSPPQLTLATGVAGQAFSLGGWIRTSVKEPGTYDGYGWITDTSQFTFAPSTAGTKASNYRFDGSSPVTLRITAADSGSGNGGGSGGSGGSDGGDGSPGVATADPALAAGRTWDAAWAVAPWFPGVPASLPLVVHGSGIRARTGLASAREPE